MVASPSLYDPLRDKVEAKQRARPRAPADARAGLHHALEYDEGVLESLPTSRDIQPPVEDTTYPYFTSWVKQQVVDKFGGGQAGARRAFEGGLTIRTTLDSRLQDAAAGRRQRLAAQPGRPARLRSSRSTTTRARSSPWSAATTTRRGRSTSRPRASASRAPPSSRSSSPRRSRRASRPTPRGRRARSTSASPRRRRAAARSTSTSTTTRTTTRACSRCAPRRRSPTTPSTPRSACRWARRRSPTSRGGWASGRPSPRTWR